MTNSTLGESLPREMARVRDEVLPAYDNLGPSGRPAAILMRRDLDSAAKALAEGDLVDMIRAYETLRSWEI